MAFTFDATANTPTSSDIKTWSVYIRDYDSANDYTWSTLTAFSTDKTDLIRIADFTDDAPPTITSAEANTLGLNETGTIVLNEDINFSGDLAMVDPTQFDNILAAKGTQVDVFLMNKDDYDNATASAPYRVVKNAKFNFTINDASKDLSKASFTITKNVASLSEGYAFEALPAT